jgi:hypothetical protein
MGGDASCELTLEMTCDDSADLFWLGIQLALRLAIPAKRPMDLFLHAAGIVREGLAYLFVGPSGAGKSTICRVSAEESGLTVLHDDIVALSQLAQGFCAWSTPFGGEMPAAMSAGAPVGAVLFPVQDDSPFVSRLTGRQAMGLMMDQMVPPVICKTAELVVDYAESLKLLLALVEYVPCYTLHFRPDPDFWGCIERQVSGGCGATAGKEGA